jgi:hypothetical protein
MDPAVPLVDNEAMKRWLLGDDMVLGKQAALAVGEGELRTLAAYYADQSQWVAAAKTKNSVHFVVSAQPQALAALEEALELLEKCGSDKTTEGLQLELDILTDASYAFANPKMPTGSAEKMLLVQRVNDLISQNTSLRTNPMEMVMATIYPKTMVLFGNVPQAFDGGRVVDYDTIYAGILLNRDKAQPLYAKACENAVGARKVLYFTYGFCISQRRSPVWYCDTILTHDVLPFVLIGAYSDDDRNLRHWQRLCDRAQLREMRDTLSFVHRQGVGGRLQEGAESICGL